MSEHIYIPQQDLAPFVKFFWYSDGYNPSHKKERVLPGGSSQIIINLESEYFRYFKCEPQTKANRCAHSVISGVHSRYIFLDSDTRKSTIGVVLKPGGIQALFGMPGDEFLDQTISLSDVIEGDVSAFRQQLAEAHNAGIKFNLLESFLAGLLDRHFRPNAVIIYAIRRIETQQKVSSISELADEVGYSRRRLSELFRNTAGIAPKEFLRIQRFQQVLNKIRKSDQPNWSQIALSCGYYDQAHFNRDFKLLSGLTPSQYFQNQTNEINHLPA